MDSTQNNAACGNSQCKPLETVGDYWAEYERINKQIVALEVQIKVLKESAERYQTDSFETALHLAGYDLCLRKKELSPILTIITRSLSAICSDVDGSIIYDRFFLGHQVQEIAREHGVSENIVSRSISSFLRASVPQKVVDECGEMLKG